MSNKEMDISVYLQELDNDDSNEAENAKNVEDNVSSSEKGEKISKTSEKPLEKSSEDWAKPSDDKKRGKKMKYEDISSTSKKPPLKKRLNIWLRRKDNKAQKVVVCILLILLILLIISGAIVWQKLSLIDTEDDYTGEEVEDLEDDINVAEMDSITDAASLNDLLKKWATNGGEKMHSKHVKNVLLIGMDSASNLSDSMILISVNELEKKTSMVSFYRDSYTYIAPDGKQPRYGKINAAYRYGGAKCLLKTLEDNYKIEIDDYILVDYNSFPKVIDSLGGVDVNVTTTEANYLNRTWRQWSLTGDKVKYSSGINHLDGEKALMFCRIRKLDSDIGRTERQRRVITSIINSFKNASLSQINNATNSLLPNIKTNMSRTAILSLVADGVSSGWLNYPMTQTSMPTEDTSKGGYVGPEWVWLVDYEGAAYQLQMLLYGQSNISMSSDRISAINLKPTNSTDTGNSSGTKQTTARPATTASYRTTRPAMTTNPVPENTTAVEESTTSNESPSTTQPTTLPTEPSTSGTQTTSRRFSFGTTRNQ